MYKGIKGRKMEQRRSCIGKNKNVAIGVPEKTRLILKL